MSDIAASTEENSRPVTVRINVEKDYPPDAMHSPGVWHWETSKILRAAGVPLDKDGHLTRGSLYRYDDPTDFGVTVWKWSPDE